MWFGGVRDRLAVRTTLVSLCLYGLQDAVRARLGAGLEAQVD